MTRSRFLRWMTGLVFGAAAVGAPKGERLQKSTCTICPNPRPWYTPIGAQDHFCPYCGSESVSGFEGTVAVGDWRPEAWMR